MPRVEMREEDQLPQTDFERVRFWREACADLAHAKKEIVEAEKILAVRAKEKRPDFKDRFTADSEKSRAVTIDGEKAGKVVVEYAAVFEINENLGEDAKKVLYTWGKKTRAYYVREIGEEKMQTIELCLDVLREVGDRDKKAALTKSAANKLRAIELPKHTSKYVREGIEKIIKAFQPLKGKVSVREAKKEVKKNDRYRERSSLPEMRTHA